MHPHLSSLHELYLAETQPFRKVHRMIDLFESIIKTHTVVIMAEYVRHNKLSDTAKGLLSQGLRTPSLGTWQLFSRVLFEELQKENFEWSLSDYAAEFIELDKALNADKTNVIAFRNGYAHGATPSDSSCEADIKKFEPFLHKLLQSKWLSASSLEEIDGKVFLRCQVAAEAGGDIVRSLHPILLYRNENSEASFAFFNDIKNDKIGLLNYPLGKHYREKDFFREFHEYLPLHEWKKSGNNEFYQRIEELTETFKGRTQERASLVQFVSEKSKGYCSIQGNPGIGKSALIAQFFKDLKAHKELKQLTVIEYFIRRGTQQAQAEYLFNYLIKRTDEVFPQGREIRAEGKMVFDLQNQLFSKWRMWNEHCQGKKLLFLIDGLDEGTENNVVTYLPHENFENILFIYGSRPGGHKSIDDLWGTLPVEHHTKLELTGLSKEDIRALIYEVANKYEVERESTWIDAVQQRSQGNPLYLKLLCDALENGSIALNDIGALPKEIDEYYRAILQRYAADLTDGDALLAGLYTFTAAKDYLTMAHLGLINKLGEATVQRIGSTLKEVLYENPLTEAVLDYQLFHESFREYLVKEKALKVQEVGERIIDFCAGWRELEGSWEQRYALEHYAAHLAESKRHEMAGELIKLLYDKPYASAQKKVLKNFNATAVLYRKSLLKASEQQLWDDQLEAALSLVDLHYEEANDAPQVVAMVANGEIDLALKRIESFGGADEEGVKRKFILCMLCLMELTLLESKTKPFRRAAIEKLLNHLDEHIPPDTSIINWNDFFPSYLMFLMAYEWSALGLEFRIVYQRTDYWEMDWISEIATYTDLQFGVLVECVRAMRYESFKSSALNSIAMELSKQGQVEEVAWVIQESLAIARCISDESDKSRTFKAIAVNLSKQGQVVESASVMQESLAIARGISDESGKSSALEDIAEELSKQGQVEESLAIARAISDDFKKSRALKDIAVELSKQGQVEESSSVMQESLAIARGISSDRDKSSALKDIAVGLSKQGKVEESLAIARGISSDRAKSIALKDIAVELSNQGQAEESASVMQESLAIARGIISDDFWKSRALKDIAVELSNQGQVEESAKVMQESLAIARGINDDFWKSRALNAIAAELSKQGQVEESASVMQESLAIAQGVSDDFWKSRALNAIAIEKSKQGQVEESLAITRVINDEDDKISALSTISGELRKQGMLEVSALVMHESLAIARGITEAYWQSRALNAIAVELSKQGQLEDSASVMQETLVIARGINDEDDKSSALKYIAVEHINLGQVEESLAITRVINDDDDKISALSAVSGELRKQGMLEVSAVVMQESLAIARGISSDWHKSRALNTIALELSKQGQVADSAVVMQESLAIASGINDESKKSRALNAIAVELTKQGHFSTAEAVGLEIPQIAQRQDAWKEISKSRVEADGWQNALRQVEIFQSDEAKLFYLKGWAENVKVTDVNDICIQQALPMIENDNTSIENLLQHYALNLVMMGKPSRELTNRLNRTLNIQWALDIAAQFPKPEATTRLSINLDTWLHEIADEDDREQVELWAKQVAKGKITEEEFGERVRGML